MTTITEYFEQAQLSMAAYATGLEQGMADNEYLAALENNNLMTSVQAANFASTYAVVDQYTDTDNLTGFSATVFDKGGEIYIAIRGTEDIFSFEGAIDWLTNINGVGADGIAIAQGLELFNYLQRLYGLEGSPVVQYSYNDVSQSISTATATASGLLTEQSEPFSVTGHSLGGHLAMMMSRLAPDIVNSVYTFNAPGFDTKVGRSIISLTSTGFFEALQNASIGPITGQIGSDWNSDIMTHLDVPGDGVSEIGTTPGVSDLIFSESANEGVIDAHSIKPIVDSLAVYNLLATLDPNLNTSGLEAITSILEASSSDPANSLESILGELRTLFLQNYAGSNVNLNDAPIAIDNREELYAKLDQLHEYLKNSPFNTGSEESPSYSFTITSLSNSGSTAESLANAAKTDIATRYALYKLNPFVLSGDVALYDQINSDGELDLYNSETGEGAMTDQYLTDRATFLLNKISSGINDLVNAFTGDDVALNSGSPIVFDDIGVESTYQLYSVQDMAVETEEPVDSMKRIIFGSSGNDNPIEGGDLSDKIYGMGGNDIITGGTGDDYIEGNAGNDSLDGGAGNDTLVGGAGDDTYIIDGESGFDQIIDSDGQGHIEFGGVTLDGTSIRQNSDLDVFINKEQGLTYAFSSDSNDLIIKSTETSATVTVKNYSQGDLGISLPVADTGPEPVTPVATAIDVDPDSPGSTGSYGPFGYWSPGVIALTYDAEVINTIAVDGESENLVYQVSAGFGDSLITGDEGTNWLIDDVQYLPGDPGDPTDDEVNLIGDVVGNDILIGLGGGDLLFSHGGDDWLYGGDGNDILWDMPDTVYGSTAWVDVEGHSSDDYLFGGTGDDVLVSDGGSDVLDGGTGNDSLSGGAHDDILMGGDGNDFLSGDMRFVDNPYANLSYDPTFTGVTVDYGDDYLDGGAGADVLFGGGGNDTLLGGSGDDLMQGDFSFAFTGMEAGLADYSDPGEIQGSDILYGGSGNDTMYGGGAEDVLYGEAGDDVIYGDYEGLDSLYHGNDFLFGGLGGDVLYGNGGEDTLEGNEGDDFLFGGDGDDILRGGIGVDELAGDDGDDTLYGDAGADLLFGNEGNDHLFGGLDNDQLVGGDGDDVLEGGVGDDFLFGEDGADTLLGGAGNDELQGFDGDDLLKGGEGDDELFGDAGNDTFEFSAGDGADGIEDTEGNQTLVFTGGVSATGVSVSIENGIVFIDYTNADYLYMAPETFSGIQSVEFSDGSVLSASELMHQFTPGNSTINNISFATGVSSDDLDFYGINDDLVIAYTGDVVNWVDTTGFNDAGIMFEMGDALDFGLQESARTLVLTNWYLSNSADYVGSINLDSENISLTTFALTGNTIVGSDDPDTLFGSAGNDTIYAYAGDDDINGDAGQDIIYGGAGDDVYYMNAGWGSDVIVDESGLDTIQFGTGVNSADLSIVRLGSDLSLSDQTGNQVLIKGWYSNPSSRIEEVIFSDGTIWNSDFLTSAGTEQGVNDNDNYLRGYDDVSNNLSGGGGDDRIVGGTLADVLDGGAGDDVLDGNGGDDTLIGGAGSDTYLIGGSSGNIVLQDDGTGGSVNIIRFATGMSAFDFSANVVGNDLILSWNEGADSATIEGYDLEPSAWQFEYASGSVVNIDTIINPPAPGESIIEGELEAFNEAIYSEMSQLFERTLSPVTGSVLSTRSSGVLIPTENLLIGDTFDSTLVPDSLQNYLPFMRQGSYIEVDVMTETGWSHSFSYGTQFESQIEIVDVQGTAESDSFTSFDSSSSSISYQQDVYLFLGGQEVSGDILGSSDEVSVTEISTDIIGSSYERPDWVPGGVLSSYGDTYGNIMLSFVDVESTTTEYLVIDAGGGNDVVGEISISESGVYGGYLNIDGGAGIDTLYGGRRGDLLYGGDDTDYIFGYDGDDLLVGGEGDDYLYGHGGSDRYVIDFALSAHDTVIDNGLFTDASIDGVLSEVLDLYNDDLDNFLLTADESLIPGLIAELGVDGSIAEDVLRINSDFSDVILEWVRPDENGNIGILISSLVNPDASVNVLVRGPNDFLGFGIEQYEFNDVTLSQSDIISLMPELPSIWIFEGTDNFDELVGTDGDDILLGKEDDDELYGGDGNDVYLYNAGDGYDYIFDYSFDTEQSGIDTLSLGQGISPEDLNASLYFEDYGGGEYYSVLLLELGDSGDDLLEIEWGYTEFNGVELVDLNSYIDYIQFLDIDSAQVFDFVGIVNAMQSELIDAYDQDLLIPLFTPDVISAFDVTGAVEVAGGEVAYNYATTGDINTAPEPIVLNEITGSSSSESLLGTDGNDLIDGGSGNDTIDGGLGDDTIIGGVGNDVLLGAGGDDTFLVSPGDGEDRFNGGDGTDTVLGTAGDDVIGISVYSGNNTVEVIDGGDGYDVLMGGSTHSTLDFSGTTLMGIEAIDGGAGSDTITGSAGDDTIIGGVGNDVLLGAGGDDTFLVSTGDGYDTVSGGDGVDTLLGTAGDDVIGINIYTGSNTVEVIDGGAGYDVIEGGYLTSTFDFSNTTLIGIEAIDGGAGSDTITGSAGNDTIIGGVGNDLLLGAGGDDTFLVSTGDGYDTVSGGEGVDTLLGTAGDDVIGINIYTGSNTVEVIDGGAGYDVIEGGYLTSTFDFSNTILIGIEAIDGGAGSDTITGSAGDDTIIGGSGNDVVNAASGNDVLDGGIGSDTLSGGSGNDLYLFGRGDNNDTINDYDIQDAQPDIYGVTEDEIQFGEDIATDQLWFSRDGNDLDVSIIGTTDTLAIKNWYLGDEYQVDRLSVTDGSYLLDAQVDQLVSAMAAFNPPAIGETALSSDLEQELQPVISTSWQSAA